MVPWDSPLLYLRAVSSWRSLLSKVSPPSRVSLEYPDSRWFSLGVPSLQGAWIKFPLAGQPWTVASGHISLSFQLHCHQLVSLASLSGFVWAVELLVHSAFFLLLVLCLMVGLTAFSLSLSQWLDFRIEQHRSGVLIIIYCHLRDLDLSLPSPTG